MEENKVIDAVRKKIITFHVKGLEISRNSMYIALITYLYLSMFHIHPIFRLAISLVTIINNLGVQCLSLIGISIACSIYYLYNPYFDSVYVYVAIFTILFIAVEIKKIYGKNYDNHLMLLIFAIVANTIIDISMKFGWEGIYYTYWECEFPTNMYRIFSIYIVYHLILFINAFTNNYRISSIIGFNLLYVLGAINYWTLAITNKEFVLSDIILVKTVAAVISEVQIQKADIAYFLLYILLITLFNIAIWKYKWRNTDRKESLKEFKYSIAYLIFMISFLLSEIIGNFTYKTYLKYGLVSNLIAGIEFDSKPSGYKQYLEEISKDNSEENDEKELDEKVNVIIIMSEAFSDLSVIGEFETNEDYMPFTRKLMKDTPSGVIYSSVYGNNTVSSEYECLTGIPTGLTKTGGELYQSNMDKEEESLVSYFKNYGYYAIGIHPYDSIGYNRSAAWDSFGFDETVWENEFENSEKIRNFVSDKSFYEKIIEKYEQKEHETPLFVFGISMQNHATYATDYEGNIKLKNLDYPDVEEYLSLIKETDEANKELIQYFSEQEEKTMIIFFGDHQPMVEADFYTDVIGTDFFELEGERETLKYKIPYFIWTNYKNDYTVPQEASTNYLPYIIINALDYPKNKWYEFLEDAYEKYPIITANFIKINDRYETNDEVVDLLNKIEEVQERNELHLLKKYQVWSYERAVEKK